mmetsp:Transcript_14943/g.32429  ORF Transcript_14943/g.32429 Transcript_14943/m.32429 type:complete len:80 (+) Transcript_14943:776-1015(+)
MTQITILNSVGDTKAEVVVVFVEAFGDVEGMAAVVLDEVGRVGAGTRAGDVDSSLIEACVGALQKAFKDDNLLVLSPSV